jgi:trans-aconitate methyltransferase
LLQKFRAGQIRLIDGAMARRAYEQLNALEFERTEDRVRYICPPGQHDDLAMSLAMLAWAADHPHFREVWVRPIEDRYRSKAKAPPFGWKAFV